MNRQTRRLALWLIGVLICTLSPARAEDWPTWRHNSGRTASTPQQLAPTLHLNWSRRLPPQTPAWPEDVRLAFDAAYHPIIADGVFYLASSVEDSILAFNASTGQLLWRFYTPAPVRFAPLVHAGRLYFGGDDGRIYALNAKTGAAQWRTTPLADRHVLGNTRLISAWPIRGGLVLDASTLRFTSGVWPFEGTNLHALDLSNDQPKFEPDAGPRQQVAALENLSPQGYLALTDQYIIVPCGRSKVACFDRKTGQPVPLRYDARGLTDWHAVASGNWLLHGDKAYDLANKRELSLDATRGVLDDQTVYTAANGLVIAYDLKGLVQKVVTDRRGKKTTRHEPRELWKLANLNVARPSEKFKGKYADWLAANPIRIHLKAANRLYASQAQTIFAIDLPEAGAAPKISWKIALDAAPLAMAAANDRLYVTTEEGGVYCFGAERTNAPRYERVTEIADEQGENPYAAPVNQLAAQLTVPDGYAFVLGLENGRLVDALVKHTQLHVIVVDADAEKIQNLRRRFTAMGRYGLSVSAHVADPLTFHVPPYIASLVTSENLRAAGMTRDSAAFLTRVYEMLRPYGGFTALPIPAEIHEALTKQIDPEKFPGAKLSRLADFSVIQRAGALAGSADWTHEYADPSNTLMSYDQRVKAPLGLLWYGGPAADGSLYFDRHLWPPSATIINGRMFIQGPGKLTAIDIYTGRILWQNPLKKLNASGRRGNFAATGYHLLAVADGVYLADLKTCLRIDPLTGKTLTTFRLPDPQATWGPVRIQGDLMLTTSFVMTKRTPDSKSQDNLPRKLVAMDRHTGKVLWELEAGFSFPFVAVGESRAYVFDGMIEDLYNDWKRKGLVPKAGDVKFIKAVDLKSGKVVWSTSSDMTATWLAYSAQHDVLLSSNKHGIAAQNGKDGNELWTKTAEGKGFAGHPESVWDKVIVWNDRIIDQRGPGMAYDIKTGKPVLARHPVTGKELEWQFTKKGHHCNYSIASPHLLTFRADTAGFHDLDTGGTMALPGIRSGCRNSLIPAGGILNAPNFAFGCVCGQYSIFTAMALAHMPDADLWTYSAYKPPTGRVERVGVNFGAPGDRQAENATLWLDYPSRGGASPDIRVRTTPANPETFRYTTAQVTGEGLKWVAASGLIGVKSISVVLNRGAGADADQPKPYTIRLHFMEPDTQVDSRRFAVSLDNQTVLKDLDVKAEAGGPMRPLVKEFKSIHAGHTLTIGLRPIKGRPIISGVEIVAE